MCRKEYLIVHTGQTANCDAVTRRRDRMDGRTDGVSTASHHPHHRHHPQRATIADGPLLPNARITVTRTTTFTATNNSPASQSWKKVFRPSNSSWYLSTKTNKTCGRHGVPGNKQQEKDYTVVGDRSNRTRKHQELWLDFAVVAHQQNTRSCSTYAQNSQ